MSTKTQLAQYAAAQQAAEEAARKTHETLLKRLDASATVIRNVWWKRFRGEPMPSFIEWINIYRQPEAVIRVTEDEQFPVYIDYKGTSYRVPGSLFYGSTWDIAKATRQFGYMQRYQDWSADIKRLNIRVLDADRTLKGKIEEIECRAKREIEELQRAHARDLDKDARLLDLRQRQVKNMKERFSSES